MSSRDFEGPSIYELYNSAKKLLSLQDRMGNRQLRKDNAKTQKLHSLRNGVSDEILHDSFGLDLLSPLSVEYLADKNGMKKPASIMDITPNSINDYSPPNTGLKMLKKDPSTVSPIQINSITPKPTPYLSNDTSPSSLGSMGMKKPPAKVKSNLTSSLEQKKDGMIECHNCHTLKTPLWRKDPDGNTLCNACGLFLKLHGTMRPLSLKTDVIKKRSSRKASTSSAKQFNSLPNSLNSPLSNGMKYNNFSNFSNSNFSSPIDMNDEVNTPNEYNNLIPKQRNILILPKPADSKSIPIPNRTPGSIPNSPAASPWNMNNEYNQLFKRKKSDLNFSRKPSVTSMSPGTSFTRKPISLQLRNSFTSNPVSFFDKSINQRPPIRNRNSESGSVTSQNSFSSNRQNSYIAEDPLQLDINSKTFITQDNLPSQDLDWLKFEI